MSWWSCAHCAALHAARPRRLASGAIGCAAAGVRPRTRPDPYPDLGLQAVREGLGVVVYVRSAFPPELAGSAFVALEPPVSLPFQLAWRASRSTAALTAVLDAARTLAAR